MDQAFAKLQTASKRDNVTNHICKYNYWKGCETQLEKAELKNKQAIKQKGQCIKNKINTRSEFHHDNLSNLDSTFELRLSVTNAKRDSPEK